MDEPKLVNLHQSELLGRFRYTWKLIAWYGISRVDLIELAQHVQHMHKLCHGKES